MNTMGACMILKIIIKEDKFGDFLLEEIDGRRLEPDCLINKYNDTDGKPSVWCFPLLSVVFPYFLF